MCDQSPPAARELSWIVISGAVITGVGLILILVQLGAEVSHLQRFGPSYVGLFVLVVGAALMALACIVSLLPKEK